MAKQAGEAFFKHITKHGRSPSLFKGMLRSLDSGQYQMPKSFEVLARFPTEELKLNHRKPPVLQVPDHKLLQAFYAQYPEARLEPVHLQSFEAPIARQFVQRQQRLMRERRMEPTAAYAATQAEMETELRSLRRRASYASSHLAVVQQEEELQLRAALDTAAMEAAVKGP